jgi:hypothetical protein
MRPSLKLLAAIVPAVLAISATPASAALNTWSGLGGLNAANNAHWVREYTAGVVPTTIYAATEGNGVYKTENNGLSWAAMNSGLDAPGAKDIRTIFKSATTIYAGTGAGLFRAAGAGWAPVAQGAESDPKNPKKLNVAVQALLTSGGALLAGVHSGGVYRSFDGGETWKPPAPGNGMARSETVWSLTEFLPGVVFAATQGGVYRSLDSGATWTLASDGITGTVLRVFKDEKAPNIYYAAGHDGIFRTVNGAVTWSKVNAGSGANVPSGIIRAMQQLSGVELTRLYVGTPNGVYSGTTDHSLLPGEVKWRKVTKNDGGLGNNTIIWALSSFWTTPGTLLAGTQSNGGYALTFTPAINTALPTLDDTTPHVGQVLTANEGTWTGTETIEYSYQWQRCTGTLPQTCSDVEDATEKTFVVPAGTVGLRWRVQVTGVNDFPAFGLNEADSAISTQTAMAPGPLPGTTTITKASVDIDDPGSDGQPQPGDVARAKGWSFNPVADVATTFQWSVCKNGGCQEIPGATGLTYTIRETDVDGKLCVAVTGRNAHGATTLECGAQTFTIVSEDPKQLAPATLTGAAYVGDTLVSTVGAWKTGSTTFVRRWMRCEADGGSCEYRPITTPAYTLTAADLGKRFKVEIKADTNGSNNLPAPVYVYTPLSDVVTTPPVAPEPSPPSGEPGPGPGPGPAPATQPAAGPAPDTVAPALGLKAVASKLKPNTALKLKATLSEAASLTVGYERKVSGRKVGRTCKAGARKGKKCTTYKKLATVKVAGVGGSSIVTLPKRKLAAGDYRVVVTPVDAAGNAGAAKTVSFKVSRTR